MSRLTGWCLGFFGALTFYWGAVTFGGSFDWVRHYRLLKEATHTEGTVTAREPKNHNVAHYEFEARGKRYRSVGQGGGGVGEKVKVFYLPDDPTFSTLKSPGEDLAFMIVAPIVLSTLAGFVVLARLGKQGHRHSRTKRTLPSG
jgi:hypothetical protein